MEFSRLLSASECARRYHVTRSTWYRMVKDGEAPEPVVLDSHKVWPFDILIEWEDGVLEACEEFELETVAAH